MTLTEQIEQSAMVLVLRERPDITQPQAFSESLQASMVYRRITARRDEDGFVCTHVSQGIFPGAITLSTFHLFHEDMNQADWDDESLCWKLPWGKDPENEDQTVYVWILCLRGVPFQHHTTTQFTRLPAAGAGNHSTGTPGTRDYPCVSLTDYTTLKLDQSVQAGQ
jgi:hypothetical protein